MTEAIRAELKEIDKCLNGLRESRACADNPSIKRILSDAMDSVLDERKEILAAAGV